MLALTKKVDYGLIALSHLALHRDKVATAREMAERYRLPQALLMNVLKTLTQQGIIGSSRGSRGGYELAREPEEITLDAIVQAIEGPVRLAQCAETDEVGPRGACELLSVCPVCGPVRRMHRRLKEFLSEVTLAEIAGDAEYGARGASPFVALALAGRAGG